MRELLILKPADEARALLAAFPTVGVETVPLEDADGRVAARDLAATEDLPPLPRSTMDGYAVVARDTTGASGGSVTLTIDGAVPMGDVWPHPVTAGHAVAISTGGVLPAGADAVVMVEFTQPGGGKVTIHKTASAGDNVVRPGDDLNRGDVVVPKGRRLRPQDVAALAAFGIVNVPVFRRPRVGILSTGNEVVAPADTPRPGQVRDMNALGLAAQARRAGARVRLAGIAPDDPAVLEARCLDLLSDCDVLLLSGGSSVGTRDLTGGVFASIGAETIFHGIDVRPGKPTILARSGDRPILGMPGVPVSAMVIFDMFVRPLVRRIGGEEVADPWPARRRGRMTRRVPSVVGREDYLRVRFDGAGGPHESRIEPLHGGSAIVSTVTRADGLVVVPAPAQGLAEGDEAEVLLYH